MSEKMQTTKTDDLRIIGMKEVSSPDKVRNQFPLSQKAGQTVLDARKNIHNILHGDDDRIFVVVGPCSIHDTKAALEYAGKLKELQEELSGELEIIMRVYFEKPRTTVGWKGLINDPDLDNSFHINQGLEKARKLLIDLADMGLPTATEFLDLISPQYVADLVSWGAIGARTTESQVHRELASGISCPVGFKNGTDGTLQIAIDAIGSSSKPHHFLSVTKQGHSAIFSTSGNEDCHIILRGGNGQPNYEKNYIDQACEKLKKAGLRPQVMVDCSHANSSKDHTRQAVVADNLVQQIEAGDKSITGIMIESHLKSGNQKVNTLDKLEYGKSITDACLAWDDTVPVLRKLAAAVKKRNA